MYFENTSYKIKAIIFIHKVYKIDLITFPNESLDTYRKPTNVVTSTFVGFVCSIVYTAFYAISSKAHRSNSFQRFR